MKIALGQPKGFLMARLLREKTKLEENMVKEKALLKSDRCIAERDTSMFNVITSKRVFFVGTELFSYVALLLLSYIKMQTESWILTHGLYEFNTVVYYSDRNQIFERQMIQEL